MAEGRGLSVAEVRRLAEIGVEALNRVEFERDILSQIEHVTTKRLNARNEVIVALFESFEASRHYIMPT